MMTPLVDLKPRWTRHANLPDGWYTGITFLSPTDQAVRIGAEFSNPMVGNRELQGDEIRCWEDIRRSDEAQGKWFHRRIGTTFSTLSLDPSIRCGSQHATVTMGKVFP